MKYFWGVYSTQVSIRRPNVHCVISGKIQVFDSREILKLMTLVSLLLTVKEGRL